MDAEFLRYQFQDGYSGVVTKQRFSIGIRHIQMLYMFSSSVIMGLVRGSVGIAVLSMNDEARRNDTYIQIHNWDKRIQGAILSSFFFGYAVMLIPAELYLRKIGGKLVLTAMLLINGALCVAMPTIANKGGWVAVCNAQLFMGMSHGCFSPVYENLLERWLPPSERNMFGRLTYGGLQLGIILAFPISGLLSECSLGWELIYYSLAIITLSMAVVIGTLTASSLEGHQAAGDSEKEDVREAQSLYRKKSLPKPWRMMLKSSKFWAIASAHAASNAIFIFYLADIPAYWKIMDMNLKSSSIYATFPFIFMWFMYLTTAPTIDWISRLGYISYIFNVTYFRKLVNALGVFGIIVGLTVVSNLEEKLTNLQGIASTSVLGFLGFQYSGFLSNHKDMTENYSGTLMVMTSAVSSLFGATVPFLSGLILNDDPSDLRRWRTVLLTLASIYAFCNVIYTAVGSNGRQEWDHEAMRKKMGHYNCVIDASQVQLDELNHTKLIQEKSENDTAF